MDEVEKGEPSNRRVPVIWHYNYQEVIGSGVFDQDGNVVITLTDPRIKEWLKHDQQQADTRAIAAMTLLNQPAVPKPEYAHIYANTEHTLLGKHFAEIAIALDLPIVGFCGKAFKPRLYPPADICPECIAEMGRRP